MHRMEYLLLSNFGSLYTIKSHSDLPSCTNKEIEHFTSTLTLFKLQESDSFPVEVENKDDPSHYFDRVITSLITWILVAVDLSPFLTSMCWESDFSFFHSFCSKIVPFTYFQREDQESWFICTRTYIKPFGVVLRSLCVTNLSIELLDTSGVLITYCLLRWRLYLPFESNIFLFHYTLIFDEGILATIK